MSLIPERPLIFYPQLATVLGIEGAIMVQILRDFIVLGASQAENNQLWVTIAGEKLSAQLPFWSESEINKIIAQLCEQGILLPGDAVFHANQTFRFAINERISNRQTPTSAQPESRITTPSRTPAAKQLSADSPSYHQGTRTIHIGWQPDADLLAQLAQYGIPRAFALDQVGEFVTYWSERNEPKHSWAAKYLKYVLRLWREEQANEVRQSQEITITADWRPSPEAMEILTVQAAINANFVEDSIAEFILYWQERGTTSSTWNSRFIQHVKRQWARFTNTLKSDLEPRPVNSDWQPDTAVYDILAMANIPKEFGEGLIAEFVLYWQENGQALSSWNTKFLQYAKRQWAYLGNNGSGQSGNEKTNDNHGTEQRHRGKGGTRNRDIAAELSDRSWAN